MSCDGPPPQSFVQTKKHPRRVEDSLIGEVVAFVFGPVRQCHRRTRFRRLSALLASAQIQVSQWVTGARCQFAAAGLLQLSGSTPTAGRQILVAKLGTQAADPAHSSKTIGPADDLFSQIGGGS